MVKLGWKWDGRGLLGKSETEGSLSYARILKAPPKAVETATEAPRASAALRLATAGDVDCSVLACCKARQEMEPRRRNGTAEVAWRAALFGSCRVAIMFTSL